MSANEYIEKDHLEPEIPKVDKKVKAKKEKKKKSSGPNALTQILNGDFLTKEFVLNNLSFIFFVMFLLLLIVGKGYYGKELSDKIDKTQKELDEMTADYVEAKARLEEETRRYELTTKMAPRGLKEAERDTKVIRLKKENE